MNRSTPRFLAFVLLAAAGCANPGAEGDPGPYFDTKAFFIVELDRLQAGDLRLVKRIDGGRDTVLTDADWRDELAFFLEYDLAHPVQEGNFRVRGEGDLRVYEAVTDHAAVREARLRFDGERPERVEFRDSVANAMYTMVKRLVYEPAASDGLPSWRIEVSQRSPLFPRRDDVIAGRVELAGQAPISSAR